MKTDWLCVVQSKVRPQLGLAGVTWSVDQKFQNFSDWRDDVVMTGDGEGSGESSRDEHDFEKQIRLDSESDKTTVRASPGWSAWGVVFGKRNSVHLEWQLQPGRHLWLLEWPPVRTRSCEGNVPWCRWDVETVPWLPWIWRRDRESLYCRWKTTWWSQEKDHGQDSGKHIEVRNEYKLPTCDDKGVFTDDEDTYRKRK